MKPEHAGVRAPPGYERRTGNRLIRSGMKPEHAGMRAPPGYDRCDREEIDRVGNDAGARKDACAPRGAQGSPREALGGPQGSFSRVEEAR
jgi:hypothetical protein